MNGGRCLSDVHFCACHMPKNEEQLMHGWHQHYNITHLTFDEGLQVSRKVREKTDGSWSNQPVSVSFCIESGLSKLGGGGGGGLW